MSHFVRLEWPRERDIRIKASAVGSCTNEMALALWTLFISLALPCSRISFAVLYIFMFILTMRNKKGNYALPSTESQQNLHEQRTLLWWWTFSSLKYRIPATGSNSESWLLFLFYSSFTCLSIYSAILHIISIGLTRYYTSWLRFHSANLCFTISVMEGAIKLKKTQPLF